jgi:cytosine/adenosine deaminase-related metal-dependent hydrolase
VKLLTSARYLVPMVGPMIEEGGILYDNTRGEIVAVGPTKELLALDYAFSHIAFDDAVLLPGLINAHTHLELTGVGQLPGPGSFVDWVIELRRRLAEVADFEEFVRAGVRQGVDECLGHGVTVIGDITLNPAITRPILREGRMSGVSFGEVLGMAGRRGQLEPRLAAAADTGAQGETLRIGIEPHAPYSLDVAGYRRCVEVAAARSLPLATHLAETADEGEFLADHSGEFARLWAAIGDWTADVPRFDGGPIRAMAEVGLLEQPAVLAHVNYASNEELALLAKSPASVVYCPRSHEYFGHPPHRFAEMLEMGINVALGTDSSASAPDLNLLEELRLVHRLRPEIPAETLFEMVTTRAARALGLERLGALRAGFQASYCGFRITGPDPLLELLESDPPLVMVNRGAPFDQPPPTLRPRIRGLWPY